MRTVVQEKIVAGCAGKGSYPAVWLQCPDTRIAPIVSMLRGQPLWSPRLPPSGTSATATPPIQGRRLDRATWDGATIETTSPQGIVMPSQNHSDAIALLKADWCRKFAERAGEPVIWEGACGLPTAERRERSSLIRETAR
jgi:hypothetical protein